MNIFELLVIAALAYAAYAAFMAKDNTAALLIGAPALYLLTSSLGSSDEFGGPDPAPGAFALANFGVIEIALVAAVIYGSYRIYNANRTASIVGMAAGAYLLYNASQGTDEF